jgi:hypothetical protein
MIKLFRNLRVHAFRQYGILYHVLKGIKPIFKQISYQDKVSACLPAGLTGQTFKTKL